MHRDSLAKRGKKSTSSSSSLNITRARKATQEGLYSKAIKALTSEGLAQPGPEILEEMLNKHPQAPPPTLPPGPPPSPTLLPESIILRSVKSFPNASAAGPSGLRPSHLREAILCPSPDRAGQILSSLSRFVNLLASGRAPTSVLPHLCGATLLACRKKSGGHRPIAIREVLRRLTSKCLSYSSRSTVTSTLTPLQLGVGVKGGCEAIIHATSHLLSSTSNKSWGLFLDFSNAFNCINQEAMFREFRNCIPNLSAWMESCYSCQPLLNLDEYSIRSCCRVQQGDPLGPLGFALTLYSLIEKLHSEVPSLRLNVWYLDNGTLMGSPDALASALAFVEREGLSLGLFLNRSKSLLFVPEEADLCHSTLPLDIPITRCGFSLLGCPVRPPDFCDEVFLNRIQKVKASLQALSYLKDAQLECTLLRSCLALPKISFILRACPPSYLHNSTAAFDLAIRETLESILGGPMSDWSWLKATLPSSRGGLDLRCASLHAPAAFLASCSQAGPPVEQILGLSPSPGILPESVVPALASAAARSDWRVPCDIDVPLHQRTLSHAIDEATFQQLLVSAPTTRSRALARSSSLPHAGDWLNVIPSTSLGLHLHDHEFRCCISYWLGVPLHSIPYSCPECQCSADIFGSGRVWW